MPRSFKSRFNGWLLRKTIDTAVRRTGELPIAVSSHIGLIRKENQDRIAVVRFSDPAGIPYILVTVCDGMGGMVDGAACAAAALSTFVSSFIEESVKIHTEQKLHNAVLAANNAIFQAYQGKGGSTLSALLFEGTKKIYSVNIGDSRIYQFEKNKLFQLTIDDTLAGQMSRDPSSYSGRNELLQFVGVGTMVEPHISKELLPESDTVFMISSDGLHFLPIDTMQRILENASEPAIAAKRLTDVAMWCGGHDNASVAILIPQIIFGLSKQLLDSDTIEIWDPFGEVQLIKYLQPSNRSRNVNETTYDSRLISREPLVHRHEIASKNNTITNSISTGKQTSATKKKRASKDPKSTIKKEITDNKEKIDSHPSTSSLFSINFPKKGENR